MHAKKRTIVPTLCCATLILISGCMLSTPGSRTNNQGGGSLITAAMKYNSNNLSALTADEVQIVTDELIAQYNLPIDPLTDEQAAAIIQFMADNNLNTIEDFQALREADADDIIISDDVRDVLESDDVLGIIEALAGVDLAGIG